MNFKPVLISHIKQADQIDRIFFKHIKRGDSEAVCLNGKILFESDRLAPSHLAKHATQHSARLGLTRLQGSTENCGEIADIFGDQKIMFHEPFDIRQARMVHIAQLLRNASLLIKAQALFRAAGLKVQLAAYPPQKFFAALKGLQFFAGKQARFDHFLRIIDTVNIFGDPEQSIEIAQAALALFDIGLDQIT